MELFPFGDCNDKSESWSWAASLWMGGADKQVTLDVHLIDLIHTERDSSCSPSRYADIEHLMIEAAAPKEGTEADAEISNGEGNGPTEAERQEAERRYHIENSHPWWQQGHDNSDDTGASKA